MRMVAAKRQWKQAKVVGLRKGYSDKRIATLVLSGVCEVGTLVLCDSCLQRRWLDTKNEEAPGLSTE